MSWKRAVSLQRDHEQALADEAGRAFCIPLGGSTRRESEFQEALDCLHRATDANFSQNTKSNPPERTAVGSAAASAVSDTSAMPHSPLPQASLGQSSEESASTFHCPADTTVSPIIPAASAALEEESTTTTAGPTLENTSDDTDQLLPGRLVIDDDDDDHITDAAVAGDGVAASSSTVTDPAVDARSAPSFTVQADEACAINDHESGSSTEEPVFQSSLATEPIPTSAQPTAPLGEPMTLDEAPAPEVAAASTGAPPRYLCRPALPPEEVHTLREQMIVPPEEGWDADPYLRPLPVIKFPIMRANCGAQCSNLIRRLELVMPGWFAVKIDTNDDLIYKPLELEGSSEFLKHVKEGHVQYTQSKVTRIHKEIIEVRSTDATRKPLAGMSWTEFIAANAAEFESLNDLVPHVRPEMEKLLADSGFPQEIKEFYIAVAQLAATQDTDKKVYAKYAHLSPKLLSNLPDWSGLVCLVRMMDATHGVHQARAGINQEELIGSVGGVSIFCLHCEDILLSSFNFNLCGVKKILICCHPDDGPTVQQTVKDIYVNELKYKPEDICDQLTIGHHHKSVFPLKLAQRLRQMKKVVYYAMLGPGQGFVLRPNTPHWGGQIGANFAVAINVADPEKFPEEILDPKKYIQCQDDKDTLLDPTSKSAVGFDDTETPKILQATGRKYKEDMIAKNWPDHPTVEDFPLSVPTLYQITNEADREILRSYPTAPEVMAKRYLFSGRISAAHICLDFNVLGVRPESVIFIHDLRCAMSEQKVTENGVDWQFLVAVFSTDDPKDIKQALVEDRQGVVLLDGVQRFSASTRQPFNFQYFSVIVLLNPSNSDLEQIQVQQTLNHENPTLKPSGFQCILFLRRVFTSVVAAFTADHPDVPLESLHTVYAGVRDTNVEKTFKRMFLLEMVKVYSAFQILLNEEEDSVNGAEHKRLTIMFCAMRKVAQIPDTCIKQLELLYGFDTIVLKHEMGFDEATGTYHKRYLGEYITPTKLAQILPTRPKDRDTSEYSKMFPTREHLYDFFSFLVDLLVREIDRQRFSAVKEWNQWVPKWQKSRRETVEAANSATNAAAPSSIMMSPTGTGAAPPPEPPIAPKPTEKNDPFLISVTDDQGTSSDRLIDTGNAPASHPTTVDLVRLDVSEGKPLGEPKARVSSTGLSMITTVIPNQGANGQH
ncbi:uncharacterized protein LOC129595087 [Paramacrobiotus metropolitanus]|uniref:uncharacterized protein LOC129595087 n=1 Tax=Paramacrobiotus metropolitanus TaxID=2943436 RepID=UPI00244626E7|nr:uncharacterized protein LOC129595087 [Paramacrobiotus metropolitanus]XP_055347975.1 uncharacterized protein LOC129595087 [Paramacrobiotus metropolitanus]